MVSKELQWVIQNVKQDERGDILVSDYQTFTITAPGPGSEGDAKFNQREYRQSSSLVQVTKQIFLAPWYTNPQTEAFCRMLDLENKINPHPYNRNNSSGTVD
jgi:lariat debranching enzyme